MKKVKLCLLIAFLASFFLFGYFYLGYCKTRNSTTSPYSTYVNKAFKFSLQFPMSWNGYYIIHQNINYIEVCFSGKSKTSKNIEPGSKKTVGLSMFYIGTEEYIKQNELIDGVKKIGSSRKKNYYFFTNTDYPISALYDVSNDSNYKDKAEKTLAYNDYLKAKQMEKDINNIANSFKAL